MNKSKHFIILLICSFCLFVNCCVSKKNNSNVLNKSDFIFDTTYPQLKSGIYMVTDSDTGVIKKLFSLDKEDKNLKAVEYKLETNNFVSFENLDSIYSLKSNSGYEGFYDITLRFNSLGRSQFYNLTKKCKDLTEAEKYDGLLLGTVVKNTLIQIVHVINPIDTNLVSISGGEFNKSTVDDIILYLKEGAVHK